MNPVVHFELPGGDLERMKKFYSETFGWKLNQMGAEMGNYVVVHTSETDAEGMIKEPGRINGGFYKKRGDFDHPSVVIAVDDIRAAMKKVTDAGGTLLTNPATGQAKPVEIPGIGMYISFEDTEGNHFSILEPRKM